jgi:23S rRNA G2069 N7-methylase RlmK/C1962 C5-methylase RlmI
VHAGAGGAVSTTSVDLSATYQHWARDNLDLNDLRGPQHRLVRADVLKWLDDPSVRGERFDRVVADPPTFSNSKRMDDVFDVQRDHPSLLDRLAGLVVPGGVVYFSTNARRFRPEGALALAAAPGSVWAVEEITKSTIPFDFRDRKIHRAWRLIRGDGRGPGR